MASLRTSCSSLLTRLLSALCARAARRLTEALPSVEADFCFRERLADVR